MSHTRCAPPPAKAAAPLPAPAPEGQQAHLGLRLRNLIYGWGTVGLVYFLSDQWQRQGTVLPASFVDEWFTFSPLAIWPYLSFFLLIPLAFLGCPAARLKPLRQAMQLCAIVAGAVYLLYPTTMLYPPPGTQGVSSQLLGLLQRLDSPQNCLPSLHMALTVLAAWALSARGHPCRTALILLWSIGIAVSIVQLRRHLAVDVLTGGLLAAAAIWLRAHARPHPQPHHASPPSASKVTP